MHLFNDEKRDYYQLEHLWADAPQLEWRRPADQADTAGPTAVCAEADADGESDAVAEEPPSESPSMIDRSTATDAGRPE